MESTSFKLRIEHCVEWNYRPDAEFIKEATLDKFENADVEIVKGEKGALEVFVTLPGKEPILVWSKKTKGDKRVNAKNVFEVVDRISSVISKNL